MCESRVQISLSILEFQSSINLLLNSFLCSCTPRHPNFHGNKEEISSYRLWGFCAETSVSLAIFKIDKILGD